MAEPCILGLLHCSTAFNPPVHFILLQQFPISNSIPIQLYTLFRKGFQQEISVVRVTHYMTILLILYYL